MQQPDGHGRYRPEIDGLRAIAVVSVIAYHLGLPGMGSGYAGVDVFFVISGFLIGGIVIRERAEGSFTYRRFYARRVRRILPALCAMMLVLLPFAWVLDTPHQLRYLGGGVIAALAFVSNIWFYTRIDYFNPDAELDPLLHTWSLGVEEQFYLVFPPLVGLLAFLHRRALLPGLVLILAASLGLALMTSESRPTLAFYMLHTRMWELMAGVLAAMAHARWSGLAGPLRSGLAVVGLGLVLFGVTALPEPSGWPGATTLVPVLGSVLVVLFASGGPAFAVLASAPFRAVGLISYSAYLIHHPMITMVKLAGYPIDGMALKLALLAASLGLAVPFWAFVEQPFRRKGALPRARRWILGATVLVLVGVAIGGHVTKGYPARLPPAAQDMLAFSESRSPTHEKCTLGRTEALALDPDTACRHNPDAPGPDVVIWGDSHVSVLAYQLARAMPEVPLREFTLGGCPPIPGMMNILQQTNAPVRMSEACAWYNKTLRDYILARDDIRLVVLYAYWTNYTERRDFDTGAGYVLPDKLYSVPVGGGAELDEAARLSAMTAAFGQLVADLRAAGKEVLIVYPLPIAAWDLPQYLARKIWKDGTVAARLGYPQRAFDDQAASARAMLDAAPTDAFVHRLDLSSVFCSGADGCTVFADGTPYFFDTNHLSQPGVALIAPRIAETIRSILAQPGP